MRLMEPVTSDPRHLARALAIANDRILRLSAANLRLENDTMRLARTLHVVGMLAESCPLGVPCLVLRLLVSHALP